MFQKGAKLIGIGSLEGVRGCNYNIGVSAAVSLPENVVRDLKKAPTKEYYDMYYILNQKLNEIVTAGEDFLREQGFEAYAGLGWIGKNGLLVTETFGPAVRISSLLTNAPLQCDRPVNKSPCKSCSLCVKNCLAQALHETLWEAGMQREKIVDVEKCYKKQMEIMYEETGIKTDLCGKCFAVCLYTQKYLV